MVGGVHRETVKGHHPMSMLDLFGTVAGAAFLVGSVALAIWMDRREPTTAGLATEFEAPPAPPPPALGGRRRLQLVHDAHR
jgi:hypothetical protein